MSVHTHVNYRLAVDLRTLDHLGENVTLCDVMSHTMQNPCD